TARAGEEAGPAPPGLGRPVGQVAVEDGDEAPLDGRRFHEALVEQEVGHLVLKGVHFLLGQGLPERAGRTHPAEVDLVARRPARRPQRALPRGPARARGRPPARWPSPPGRRSPDARWAARPTAPRAGGAPGARPRPRRARPRRPAWPPGGRRARSRTGGPARP